jgi:hypothetical protein
MALPSYLRMSISYPTCTGGPEGCRRHGAFGAQANELRRFAAPRPRDAVDRQYLDTAEGAQTVDVVEVSVDTISCRD